MNNTSTDTHDKSALLASIGLQLTEDEARWIFSLRPYAVFFVMMEMARRLAEAIPNRADPATPSSQISSYSNASDKVRSMSKSGNAWAPGFASRKPCCNRPVAGSHAQT